MHILQDRGYHEKYGFFRTVAAGSADSLGPSAFGGVICCLLVIIVVAAAVTVSISLSLRGHFQ